MRLECDPENDPEFGWRSPPHWDTFVLAAWYGFLAIMVLLAYLVLTHEAEAVELAISGNSVGTGLHNLTFSGDLLNATILQGGNNSTWYVAAGMGAS